MASQAQMLTTVFPNVTVDEDRSMIRTGTGTGTQVMATIRNRDDYIGQAERGEQIGDQRNLVGLRPDPDLPEHEVIGAWAWRRTRVVGGHG
ncbi:hypothetical protein [Prescottella equi]|uniref:hypothetical protein n=1 Tax=Rhodococcus hoagii TaxID=43767 RepID=UPI001C74FBF2|nr:hypothetical protein [Prescottella equi]BCN83135.1 hypothetical protein RE0356_17760 [Prescottella equi]